MDKIAAHRRFIQAIDYLKDNGKARNHEEIAKLTGVSRPNITAAINMNERYVTLGTLRKFASAYSDYINEEWLLTGEGEMKKLSKDMRPHYPATVEAGILGGAAPSVMDYEVIMEPVVKHFPYYDYMIDVRGRSMEPSYFDGDVVACRKLFDRKEISPGKVYVIATHDGAVIKRIISSTMSSLRVSSDNPDYKPYNIDLENIVDIAEVVGSIRSNQISEESIKNAILKYVESVLMKEQEGLSDAKKREIINKILH